jgi:hypothetical protein
MGLFLQKLPSSSTQASALGSFFQPSIALQNWLRSVKTSRLSDFGSVFSNSWPEAQLASNGKTSHVHQLPHLGSFFQPTSSRPNWLRSVIRTHTTLIPSPAIAFSSLPLRKISHPAILVLSHLKPSLCYSISSTGCKLNWAPAFQVTPDRVRSKLLSVVHQARPTQIGFSSGPKRPSLVNLSHSQTQGANRRQK